MCVHVTRQYINTPKVRISTHKYYILQPKVEEKPVFEGGVKLLAKQLEGAGLGGGAAPPAIMTSPPKPQKRGTKPTPSFNNNNDDGKPTAFITPSVTRGLGPG